MDPSGGRDKQSTSARLLASVSSAVENSRAIRDQMHSIDADAESARRHLDNLEKAPDGRQRAPGTRHSSSHHQRHSSESIENMNVMDYGVVRASSSSRQMQQQRPAPEAKPRMTVKPQLVTPPSVLYSAEIRSQRERRRSRSNSRSVDKPPLPPPRSSLLSSSHKTSTPDKNRARSQLDTSFGPGKNHTESGSRRSMERSYESSLQPSTSPTRQQQLRRSDLLTTSSPLHHNHEQERRRRSTSPLYTRGSPPPSLLESHLLPTVEKLRRYVGTSGTSTSDRSPLAQRQSMREEQRGESRRERELAKQREQQWQVQYLPGAAKNAHTTEKIREEARQFLTQNVEEARARQYQEERTEKEQRILKQLADEQQRGRTAHAIFNQWVPLNSTPSAAPKMGVTGEHREDEEWWTRQEQRGQRSGWNEGNVDDAEAAEMVEKYEQGYALPIRNQSLAEERTGREDERRGYGRDGEEEGLGASFQKDASSSTAKTPENRSHSSSEEFYTPQTRPRSVADRPSLRQQVNAVVDATPTGRLRRKDFFSNPSNPERNAAMLSTDFLNNTRDANRSSSFPLEEASLGRLPDDERTPVPKRSLNSSFSHIDETLSRSAELLERMSRRLDERQKAIEGLAKPIDRDSIFGRPPISSSFGSRQSNSLAGTPQKERGDELPGSSADVQSAPYFGRVYNDVEARRRAAMPLVDSDESAGVSPRKRTRLAAQPHPIPVGFTAPMNIRHSLLPTKEEMQRRIDESGVDISQGVGRANALDSLLMAHVAHLERTDDKLARVAEIQSALQGGAETQSAKGREEQLGASRSRGAADQSVPSTAPILGGRSRHGERQISTGVGGSQSQSVRWADRLAAGRSSSSPPFHHNGGTSGLRFHGGRSPIDAALISAGYGPGRNSRSTVDFKERALELRERASQSESRMERERLKDEFMKQSRTLAIAKYSVVYFKYRNAKDDSQRERRTKAIQEVFHADVAEVKRRARDERISLRDFRTWVTHNRNEMAKETIIQEEELRKRKSGGAGREEDRQIELILDEEASSALLSAKEAELAARLAIARRAIRQTEKLSLTQEKVARVEREAAKALQRVAQGAPLSSVDITNLPSDFSADESSHLNLSSVSSRSLRGAPIRVLQERKKTTQTTSQEKEKEGVVVEEKRPSLNEIPEMRERLGQRRKSVEELNRSIDERVQELEKIEAVSISKQISAHDKYLAEAGKLHEALQGKVGIPPARGSDAAVQTVQSPVVVERLDLSSLGNYDDEEQQQEKQGDVGDAEEKASSGEAEMRNVLEAASSSLAESSPSPIPQSPLDDLRRPSVAATASSSHSSSMLGSRPAESSLSPQKAHHHLLQKHPQLSSTSTPSRQRQDVGYLLSPTPRAETLEKPNEERSPVLSEPVEDPQHHDAGVGIGNQGATSQGSSHHGIARFSSLSSDANSLEEIGEVITHPEETKKESVEEEVEEKADEREEEKNGAEVTETEKDTAKEEREVLVLDTGISDKEEKGVKDKEDSDEITDSKNEKLEEKEEEEEKEEVEEEENQPIHTAHSQDSLSSLASLEMSAREETHSVSHLATILEQMAIGATPAKETVEGEKKEPSEGEEETGEVEAKVFERHSSSSSALQAEEASDSKADGTEVVVEEPPPPLSPLSSLAADSASTVGSFSSPTPRGHHDEEMILEGHGGVVRKSSPGALAREMYEHAKLPTSSSEEESGRRSTRDTVEETVAERDSVEERDTVAEMDSIEQEVTAVDDKDTAVENYKERTTVEDEADDEISKPHHLDEEEKDEERMTEEEEIVEVRERKKASSESQKDEEEWKDEWNVEGSVASARSGEIDWGDENSARPQDDSPHGNLSSPRAAPATKVDLREDALSTDGIKTHQTTVNVYLDDTKSSSEDESEEEEEESENDAPRGKFSAMQLRRTESTAEAPLVGNVPNLPPASTFTSSPSRLLDVGDDVIDESFGTATLISSQSKESPSEGATSVRPGAIVGSSLGTLPSIGSGTLPAIGTLPGIGTRPLLSAKSEESEKSSKSEESSASSTTSSKGSEETVKGEESSSGSGKTTERSGGGEQGGGGGGDEKHDDAHESAPGTERDRSWSEHVSSASDGDVNFDDVDFDGLPSSRDAAQLFFPPKRFELDDSFEEKGPATPVATVIQRPKLLPNDDESSTKVPSSPSTNQQQYIAMSPLSPTLSPALTAVATAGRTRLAHAISPNSSSILSPSEMSQRDKRTRFMGVMPSPRSSSPRRLSSPGSTGESSPKGSPRTPRQVAEESTVLDESLNSVMPPRSVLDESFTGVGRLSGFLAPFTPPRAGRPPPIGRAISLDSSRVSDVSLLDDVVAPQSLLSPTIPMLFGLERARDKSLEEQQESEKKPERTEEEEGEDSLREERSISDRSARGSSGDEESASASTATAASERSAEEETPIPTSRSEVEERLTRYSLGSFASVAAQAAAEMWNEYTEKGFVVPAVGQERNDNGVAEDMEENELVEFENRELLFRVCREIGAKLLPSSENDLAAPRMLAAIGMNGSAWPRRWNGCVQPRSKAELEEVCRKLAAKHAFPTTVADLEAERARRRFPAARWNKFLTEEATPAEAVVIKQAYEMEARMFVTDKQKMEVIAGIIKDIV